MFAETAAMKSKDLLSQCIIFLTHVIASRTLTSFSSGQVRLACSSTSGVVRKFSKLAGTFLKQIFELQNQES